MSLHRAATATLHFRFWRWLPAFVLALAAPILTGENAAPAPPPPAFTAEQKAALDALDGAIARFDALIARDDDVPHQAATKAVLDEFKQRRAAIRQAFDQSRYDELRVDLNLEFQRLASWLAVPTTPPPPPDDRHRK